MLTTGVNVYRYDGIYNIIISHIAGTRTNAPAFDERRLPRTKINYCNGNSITAT